MIVQMKTSPPYAAFAASAAPPIRRRTGGVLFLMF
jgi:hypothetical protein